MSSVSRTAARPAYRDAHVLRWLGAYTASVTGDVIYFLALTWAVTDQAGPAQAGVVLAAGAVPRAVLMLAGGVIADRFGPRRALIGSDLVRCLVVLSVAATGWLAGTEMWMLFGLAIVFGVVDAVFMPAVGALPPRLVAADQLARVQGLRMLAVRLSNAVGPLVAAVVLTTGGASGGLAAAGLLFTMSLALLLAVRIRPDGPTRVQHASPRAAFRHDLADGIRYLRAHRRVATLVLVIGLSEMCFSGPVGIGLVLLADERHWGVGGAGWALGAFSVGGGISSLVLTALGRQAHAGVTMSCALLLTAATVVATGYVPGLGVAVVLSGLTGAASAVAMVVSHAALQKTTAPGYLGRVTSVVTLCTLGLSPLLYPLTGLIAATWGAGVFFACCGVICLVAGSVCLAVPSVRAVAV